LVLVFRSQRSKHNRTIKDGAAVLPIRYSMDGLLPDDGDQAILGSSMSGERLNRLLFGLHCDAKTTTGGPCPKAKKCKAD
jgi:hypothetical protein